MVGSGKMHLKLVGVGDLVLALHFANSMNMCLDFFFI